MVTEIKAKLNHLRFSPRKVRFLTALIQNMDVNEAEHQLKFALKAPSNYLLKLMNSAVASAKNDFNLEKDALYIKKITVNEGPPFKRWRASSRGRAMPITKRTSHVSLVLGVKSSFIKTMEDKKVIKETEPSTAPKESTAAKSTKISQERDKNRREKSKTKKPALKAPKKISKKPDLKSLAKKIFRRKSF